MSGDVIILCGPPKNCYDEHVLRSYCMRGMDGAADDVCPLKRWRGARRRPPTLNQL